MKKSLIIVSALALILVGCTKSARYNKLEKELTDKATKYYEDYIEGKVLGLNSHTVSLEALDIAGVDIKDFEEEECDKASYATITVNLDEEGKVVGDYTIKNHLKCGEYETKKD